MDSPPDMDNSKAKIHFQDDIDVMNDPADTIDANGKSSLEEADTCRICRGEGSVEEPLFYPCKCSGSIKFVHQECLMEWLAHSHKKHCELCKTPFRFTKLYHPHMPNTVPLPVFLRQASLHAWKTITTWSRFQLVVLVWLVWLPWCMRTIWRGLFWIADGGWVDWTERRLHDGSATSQAIESLNSQGYSPVNKSPRTSREAMASSVLFHISNKLPQFLSPIRHLHADGPLLLRTVRRIQSYVLGSTSYMDSSVAFPVSKPIQAKAGPRSSWLSDVYFLKNVTRSRMINNIIIDTFEGLLITILIVTAFILVFLIREWVVQQQPNLNGGADVDAMVAAGQNAVVLAPRNNEERARQGQEREGEHQPAGDGALMPEPQGIMALRAGNRHQRPRNPRLPSELGLDRADESAEYSEMDEAGAHRKDLANAPDSQGSGPSEGIQESSGVQQAQRPPMPEKAVLARAAEIRRAFEENEGSKRSRDVFDELWKRSNHNPDEVLRIIEQEGDSNQFTQIVEMMSKFKIHETTIDRASNLTETRRYDDSRQDVMPEGESSSTAGSSFNEEVTGRMNGARNIEKANPASLTMEQPPTSSTDVPSAAEIPSSSAAEQHQGLQWSFASVGDGPTGALKKSSSLEEPLATASDPAAERANSAFAFQSDVNNNPFRADYDGQVPKPSTLDAFVNNGEGASQAPETVGPIVASLDANVNESSVEVPNVQDAPGVRGLGEVVTEWLWGAAPLPLDSPEAPAADDEHIVNDIAEEAPFVAIDRGQPARQEANAAQDQEVIAAAMQAGVDPNDVEAVDEIEDLEGILELVGMHGPLAGLVQNGMFCAILVSLTIMAAVLIPYIFGKVFLVVLANPVSLLLKAPLKWGASSADVVIDCMIFIFGCTFYWTHTIFSFVFSPIVWLLPPLAGSVQAKAAADAVRDYGESALDRLGKVFVATGGVLVESDIPTFSILAHESLQTIKASATWALQALGDSVVLCFNLVQASSSVLDLSKQLAQGTMNSASTYGTSILRNTRAVASLAPSLLQMNPLQVNLNMPQRTAPLNYDLAQWDSKDRALAVVSGYILFGFIGVIYLHISTRIRGARDAGRVEGAIADALYQAGGVIKVVLIISIEMIVFPLYCGLLLDVALLPLFGNVTVMSRITFTLTSPYTSVFVHWFVGTCYMFHFALFVSMCRRILCSGVLFFIRDPDDPNFHPVRDVLERSVTTQLWKISFSALVYGGLVIVCLGGVVWGIDFAVDGILPIHWSSNEPILEFPVDLLFYNFLMPMAVKLFRPSKGMNAMYAWWFAKCAQHLRLTNFLLGKIKIDEEGTYIRRRWTDVFNLKPWEGEKTWFSNREDVPTEVENGRVYFVRDGKFVRAPASDQVRIPKGARTFVEVNVDNHRLDGQPEQEQGLHGRGDEMFRKVYIPPLFRVRISVFVFLIWLFAAATGVSFTIVPLVLGRFIFTQLAPTHFRINDIYAFSIGIYILGGLGYALYSRHTIITFVKNTITPHTTTITAFLYRTAAFSFRLASVIYTYAAFGLVLPAMLSLLMEFYLIIPLHTYVSTTFTSLNNIHQERHIIHLIQDWTLGVLYLKMAARIILYNDTSRPANALRGIVRNGWLRPNALLATRGFIIPAVVTMAIALSMPLALGWVLNHTILYAYSTNNEIFRACVYRYSFPGILFIGFVAFTAVLLGQAFAGWRKRVRDEVYLIGERLHNFGEPKRRKTPPKGKERAVDMEG